VDIAETLAGRVLTSLTRAEIAGRFCANNTEVRSAVDAKQAASVSVQLNRAWFAVTIALMAQYNPFVRAGSTVWWMRTYVRFGDGGRPVV